MAVGGAVAATLAPFAIGQDEWTNLGLPWMSKPVVCWLFVIGKVALTGLAIPVLSHLLNVVLRRIVGKKLLKPKQPFKEMCLPRWAFLGWLSMVVARLHRLHNSGSGCGCRPADELASLDCCRLIGNRGRFRRAVRTGRCGCPGRGS